MKKWLFCALVLAAIPALSFGGLGGEDVGKLNPVQLIALSEERGGVQLQTDTGDLGTGETVRQAVSDMNESAPAKVFLDTADYLLVEPGAELWLPQLQEYLRPSCNICYVTGEVDFAQAVTFLQRHEPKLTLTQYEAGELRLPYLISKEGRLKLVHP